MYSSFTIMDTFIRQISDLGDSLLLLCHPLNLDQLSMSKEFTDQFHLPEPNMFIAEYKSLCAPDPSFTSKHPVKLLSNHLGELFYQQLMSSIQYLLMSATQTNFCLMDLLVVCLMQYIIEGAYPTDLIQLAYFI